jgi:ABC-type Zn uptake system ZnuABC Zn-binding protein ZnuA
MKTLALLATVALLGGGHPSPRLAPPAPLNVVATTPDLAALARAIGGSGVDVKALAKPTEDPHFVDAKPSLIVTLNRADVLIQNGAELELGWLPALMQSARNPKIAPGAPGNVDAHAGIKMLEVPTSFDRSKGDVHALGNPHFTIDPANARIVAGEIADHLAQVQPANAAMFKANLAKFDAALDAKMAQWQAALAPYKGTKIITFHNDFPYFSERFGLPVAATLEPKPGISPSPAHLAEVIATMKSGNAHVILVQPFQNRRTAETVARQADGVVIDAPQMPGVQPQTDDYIQLMDYLVRSLATALKEKQ